MTIFRKRTLLTAAIIGVSFLAAAAASGGNGEKKSKEKPKASRSDNQPVQAVKLVKAETVPPTETRSVPGRTLAVTETRLSFRVPGRINELPITIGQAVKKGDVIARLDSDDYQFALDQAKADLESAKARLINAKLDYQRKQELWASKDIDASVLDAARAEYRSLKDEIEGLKALVSEAKKNLDYTTLRAPFAGEIVDKYVNTFDLVEAGEPIAELIDSSGFEVRAYLPEKLFLERSRFRAFSCLFAGYPQNPFEAELKGIGQKALPPTLTYPLTVTVKPTKELKIHSGMEVEVVITIDRSKEAKNIFVLPTAAVVSGPEGKSLVWIYDNKSSTVSSRPVTVGKLTDGGIEITKGLKEGEMVVAAGGNYLHQGQKARPEEKNLE